MYLNTIASKNKHFLEKIYIILFAITLVGSIGLTFWQGVVNTNFTSFALVQSNNTEKVEYVNSTPYLHCQDVYSETIFDFTVAPPLLFFAYIPILIVLISLALMVWLKNRTPLVKYFVLIIASFSLWTINVILQWTLGYSHHVHFAWKIIPLLELPIYFLSFAFIFAFIFQKKLPLMYRFFFYLLLLPVILLLPTPINISSFDLTHCEGVSGRLWDYIYVVEILTIFAVAYISVKGFGQIKEPQQRKSFLFIASGTLLFLTIFFLSEFIGELTRFYEINLLGPVGALLFALFIGWSIVKFNLFNFKLFGVQALIGILWFIVFSLLFVHTISLVQTIVAITLVLLTIVGGLLIRGFSREVKQREEITLLAQDLQKANARLKELDKQKSEFVSLASHQLRGPITAVNGYVSLILSGDYGPISREIQEALTKVQTASQDLGVLVGDYLDITRIELGRMKYEFANVSFTQIVKDVCDQMSQVADHSGLRFEKQIPDEPMMVYADAKKLKQVMLNLVDNAIKYTPQGTITVSARVLQGKAQFSVKDTGTGMSTKVLESIFEKFVRAPGAQRVNATGTGLGLFVARKIITEHKGRIWAESAGEGKGSTFLFEVDMLK